MANYETLSTPPTGSGPPCPSAASSAALTPRPCAAADAFAEAAHRASAQSSAPRSGAQGQVQGREPPVFVR